MLLKRVDFFAAVSCGDSKAENKDKGENVVSDVNGESTDEADEADETDETVEADETVEDVEVEIDLSTAVLAGHEEIAFEEAMEIYEDGLLEYVAEEYDEVSLDASWVEGWSGEGAPDEAELLENELAYTYVFDAAVTDDGEDMTTTMEVCLALDTETGVFSVKGVVYTEDGEYDYSYFGDEAVEEIDWLYDDFVYAE